MSLWEDSTIYTFLFDLRNFSCNVISNFAIGRCLDSGQYSLIAFMVWSGALFWSVLPLIGIARLVYALHIYTTVPTFKSCTKCIGKPRHNARSIATQFLGMNAWMNSQMNVVLIRKLCVSWMCLAYLFDIIQVRLYNQALADVQSTGTGIKCLQCMSSLAIQMFMPLN